MKKPTILIAEVDETASRNLKGLFLQHGFDVIESPVKTSIPRSFQSQNIDLIVVGSFSDASSDGVGVAQEIRDLDRKVPIILIAEDSSEGRAIAALRAGINDYFKRPFSFEELAASVDRCLYHFGSGGFPANYEMAA